MEAWRLHQRAGLPLKIKTRMSLLRIEAWIKHWDSNVYVSFSGGKDSTVLLDLVRSVEKSIPAVFIDTGLEYPEIRDFVKTIDNVVWIKPKKSFSKVVREYGFPVVSKEVSGKIYEIRNTNSMKLLSKRVAGDERGFGKLSDKWHFLLDAPFKISSKCCDVLKKQPAKEYENRTGRKPIVGTMASDSSLRTVAYLKGRGCNSFESSRPMSTPLAFWHGDDVWEYIKNKNLPYSKIYDMGLRETGCMFCMFGLHRDKFDRFDLMRETHPKQYNYCMDTLGLRSVISFMRCK